MSLNKKQLQRMVYFIKKVKENNYPNSYSFADYLRKLDLEENINIASTPRTIQRDIRILKEEFHAPLVYDHTRSGYTLISPEWEFTTPVLSESEIITMVIGGQLAETILPASPIKTRIRDSIAQQLTTNNSELLETAYLDAFMVCARMTVNIDGEIFQTVFDAWRRKEALDIEYVNAKGKQSLRRIDPHILAFQDGAWFIKAYCHLKNKVWIFSIHRIVSAAATGKYFEHDKHLVEHTKRDGLFELERIQNIVLRCDKRIINYARDYQFHPEQEIITLDNDQFELHIPSAQHDELVRWIMCQTGQAAVVKPAKLKKEIREYAEKIVNLN